MVSIAEEQKLKKEELKAEAKARKEEEKAAKAEEKRLAKEEKEKGAIIPSISNNEDVPESSEPSTEEAPQHKHRLSRPFTPKITTQKTSAIKQDADSPLSPATSPDSPSEHSNRVKNWLSKLRHRAKSTSVNNTNTSKQTDERPPGAFIGGHALNRLHADGTGSLSSLSESDHRSASIRDVALAGRRPTSSGLPQQSQDEEGESSGSKIKREGRVFSNTDGGDTVSSVSINSSLSRRREGADGPPALARPHVPAPLELDFAGGGKTLAPPPGIADPAAARRSGSPRSVGSGHSNRDSRFVENID